MFPMISFLNGRFYCGCPIPAPTVPIGGASAEPDPLFIGHQNMGAISLLSMGKAVPVFVLDVKTGWGFASTWVLALQKHRLGWGLPRTVSQPSLPLCVAI